VLRHREFAEWHLDGTRGVHEHLRHDSREVTLSLPLDGAQFRDAQWWHQFTIAVDIEPEPGRAYELGVLGMAKPVNQQTL
jgi:hypothetical protein